MTPPPRRKRLVMALGVLGALVAVCALSSVVFFLAQPTSFRIARSRTIAASPDAIRAELVDLREFVAWEPWSTVAATHRTFAYSDPAVGQGAWVEVRTPREHTRFTIVSVSAERVAMTNDLGGGAPPSRQVFELHPVSGGTQVTWAFENELHGVGRALWPFVRLDARVGPDLEAALGRLARRVSGR